MIEETCPGGEIWFDGCLDDAEVYATCMVAHIDGLCEIFEGHGGPVRNDFTDCVDEAFGIERVGGIEAWNRLQDQLCVRAHECSISSPEYAYACHPVARERLLTPELRSVLEDESLVTEVRALDWLREAPCFDFKPIAQDVQRQVFLGSTQERAPCTHDVECQPWLYCNAGSVCPGQCEPRGYDGEPCDRDGECEFGCFDGRCGVPTEPGSSCETRTDCFSDAGCVAGRCSFRGPGDTCDSSDECSKLLVCTDGLCVEGGRLGDPCDELQPCGLSRDSEGLLCVSGTCARYVGVGEPCADSQQCPPMHACNRVCEPLPDIGDACTDRCVQGACVDGTCSWLNHGEACSLVSDVDGLGACSSGACVQAVCGADFAVGDACEATEQCEDYAGCDGGVCETWQVCAL